MPGEKPQVSFFATTRWTLVGEAGAEDPARAREGLAELFRIYWPPLYRYVRRLGHGEHDAEDLVQGFFAHLWEGQGLRHADVDRGRFRAFLLGSLKHFLANEWRHAHRQKRGGFATKISIDRRDAETGLALDPTDPLSPDVLFDREWAMALLDKVLADLEAEEEDFARWKPFLGVGSNRIAYAEIADRFGMTEGAARVAVHRLRKRYRHRLREEIARTLVSGDLVDEEMQALFSALAEW